MLLVPVDPTAPYKILLLFTSVSTLLRTKFIAKFPLKRYKIWNLNEKIYIYTYIFANMYDFKDDNLVGNAGWWRQRGSNCLIKIEWTMSNDSNFIDNLKFRPHHVICRSAHATIFSTRNSLWNWIVLMNPLDEVNKNLAALHLLVWAWIGGKLNLPSYSFISYQLFETFP